MGVDGCMSVHVCMHTYGSVCMWESEGAGSFLSTCGFCGLNPSHQAWQIGSLSFSPDEPSHRLEFCFSYSAHSQHQTSNAWRPFRTLIHKWAGWAWLTSCLCDSTPQLTRFVQVKVLGFWRGKSPSWQEIMVANHRCGSGNRLLGTHIPSCKHRAERSSGNRERHFISKPFLSDFLLPPARLRHLSLLKQLCNLGAKRPNARD